MRHTITYLILVLLLMVSCQKKKETTNTYKNKVIVVLNNLDSLPLKDIDKEKTLDTLSQFVLTHNNDSINRNLIFKVANKYYDSNKLDKYLNLSNKVLELSTKKKDTAHIAKSLCFIGYYQQDKSHYDSAYSYYYKSEKLYEIIKDTLMTGRTSILKGSVLFQTGNFAESETETVKALRILSKTKRIDLVFNCYNIIAISLQSLNDYQKSLDYFDLALKQLDKMENESYPKETILRNRIPVYNNIARVYEKLEKYQIAINFYNKGLRTKNIKKDYPKYYAMLLENLAYSKMKSGNFEDVERLFLESLKVRDSLGLEFDVASNKIDLGEYYLLKKDTAKGFAYVKEGYLACKKLKSNQYTIVALKLLMENDTKNKTYYTNQYVKISDSVQQVERATRNKFARIAYETDQVEEKNVILSKTISNVIIGSGILIFLLGGFFIIYRLKSRNKELLFVKEQQEANEKIYQLMLHQQSETQQARNEERNRIAMELHDGIVNSIFTTRFSLIQLESESEDKKQQLVHELEKAESEIRRVSHDLKQNLLVEDKTLPEILANLVGWQQNEFGTKFDLSVDKFIDWSLVSSEAKINVYRIIQEALQNSSKYSKAERCCVFLLKTGDTITLRIWDNGLGFNPEKAKQGIGLKNIKERTKALNGALKINSEIGKGTTLEVVF
jgi:signal transduction histidine kinase